MSVATAAGQPYVSLQTTVERTRLALLWLTGLSGAFVFMEPSLYEVASLLTMTIFIVTGLALNATIMPLAIVLVVYNIGFSLAVIPVVGQPRTLIWVLVSWYLAATCVFLAAALAVNTERRLTVLMRGYVFAAVVASVAGVGAYFGLFGSASSLFLRYGRAQGTFNDPNVLGAFLILPAMVALQRVLLGRLRENLTGGLLFALFSLAVLLSFSRAAWGQLAFCSLVLMLLTFATTDSSRVRIRIVLLSVVGMLMLAAFLAALLSIDQVAALFKERASLDQSYNSGPTGRFGRHVAGFLLALETPFGLGPLQFAKRFPEDPHNAYLNAFVSGGWISGLSYALLVIFTLLLSLRYLFVVTPWRNLYLVVFTAFLGVAIESLIIDSDHWRHYFLLMGVQWGLIAATVRHLRQRRAARQTALRPAFAA